MEASPQMPQGTLAEQYEARKAQASTASEHYQADVWFAQMRFADEFAAADGGYSRLITAAGLVRDELVNQSKARRDASLDRAEADYRARVALEPQEEGSA